MFSRILVPLDGSPFAEAAFPVAIAIAERVGGEIHLLSVRPHLWSDEAAPLERALDQEAWAYLGDAATRLRASTSVPVSCDMTRGDVVEEIVEEAEASHDLIVMTSHGRGGLSRIWLGSVTDACLRSTKKPLLVVRPPHGGETTTGQSPTAFRLDRVVVPLDGSTLSESALPTAVALADAFGVPLLLVRSVLAPVPLDTAPFPAPDWVPVDPRELIAGATAELERVAAVVQTAHGRPTTHVDIGRHPALAIGDAAGIGGMVVMAAHPHGELRRAFLGSVSDKVVRTADGPVLVLKPPQVGDAPESRWGRGAARVTERKRRTVEA
ncbi:MAG: universal stress protein [Gemmatimonadales bacterium]